MEQKIDEIRRCALLLVESSHRELASSHGGRAASLLEREAEALRMGLRRLYDEAKSFDKENETEKDGDLLDVRMLAVKSVARDLGHSLRAEQEWRLKTCVAAKELLRSFEEQRQLLFE